MSQSSFGGEYPAMVTIPFIGITKMILLITNSVVYHIEIIESIIVKYKEIIGNKEIDEIYLYLLPVDKSFIDYIGAKYPDIKFGNPEKYDYYIEATLVPEDYPKIKDNDSSTHFYISHRLSNAYNGAPNIFYLTPLSSYNVFNADVLPAIDKIETDIPIFVIQGAYNRNRRNYQLLTQILDTEFEYDYKIKLLGRGIGSTTAPPLFPTIVNKYKNKLIVCDAYNFFQYHQAFSDCYCILTLVSKNVNFQYYKNQLTSSINYAKGYNIKCLIDTDLQNIYKLSNVEVYDQIVDGFRNSLREFYEKGKQNKNMFITYELQSQ